MASLYSAHKIFHFMDKVASLPREGGRVTPPVHVRIKPTNVCNHRCRYCAYRADGLQLGKDMREVDSIPWAKLSEILDDLVSLRVRAVTFSGGGEPFAYPHLASAMRRLAEAGVRFASLSNGSLLRGEAAEILAAHGTWVRISLDGWDGESYARYRGVGPDAFVRTLGNIAAFKRLGGKCLAGINVIVDAENCDHLVELVGQVRDAGADSVKFSPCIVANDGGETNAYHAPFFARVKAQIAEARERFAGPGFHLYDAYHEIAENFRKGYAWCPYLQILPVIGADQNVYSCQDKAYNLDCGLLGSLRDTRFAEFWMGDREKFFRINPARDCNHHCVSDAKNRMLLDFLEADPDHLDFV